MIKPIIHTYHQKGIKVSYMQFDSVQAFNGFVDQEALMLDSYHEGIWKQMVDGASQKLQQRTKFYGEPVPKNVEELAAHDTFTAMDKVQEVKTKIEKQLQDYEQFLSQELLPIPKVRYNDRGLGVFSFDRAAMGLFSQIPINLSTPMHTGISQMNVALDHRRPQTSIRQVYAYFENKTQTQTGLTLYVMMGANMNVTGEELRYVGIACYLLAEFMELRNIPIAINVLLGSQFEKNRNLSIIRVKRFQDALDMNQLLLMTSDPRYFRFRGFKALIAMSNAFGTEIPNSLGRMFPAMAFEFVQELAPGAVVFEQSYSLNTATKEVLKHIKNYAKEHKKQTAD